MTVTTQMLEEAQSAYHDLMRGRAVVKVRDQNGEEITFNAANLNRLSTYIQDLKRQLGLLTEGVAPMKVWF